MISKRTCSAIRKYAQQQNLEDRIEHALATLAAIAPRLGEKSRGRKMLNCIGITLLQDSVTIIAPSCPDYSYTDGKYTFHQVGNEVPLLSQLHIAFLDTLMPALPHAHCEIVVADQEAEDTVMCQQVGLTKEELLTKIHESIQATQACVAEKGWQVHCMTERFPRLQSLEVEIAKTLAHDETLSNRINIDTLARSKMYRAIGVSDVDEMRQRTIRTAAQYCALAHIAADEKLLVCNHETTNLGWFTQYGAAMLHNPLSDY